MEKKNYWLKLPQDFFKNQDIASLEQMDNGKDFILFYIKLLHKSISTNGNIDYPMKMLASFTNTDIRIVEEAMIALEEFDLIIKTESGWKMKNVNIGSESLSADRVRKLRERKANGSNSTQSELHCNVVNENTKNALHCNTQVKESGQNALQCNTKKSINNNSSNNTINKYSMICNVRKGSDYGYDLKNKENKPLAPANIKIKKSLDEYIFICNVIMTEIGNNQDRSTQERFGAFMLQLGNSIASKKTINIKGKDVNSDVVLDAFRSALETGESDEMFVRTIRDTTAKALNGKIYKNQELYLISTLYERIKAGGAV